MFAATLRVGSLHADTIARSIGPEAGREIPRTRADVAIEGSEVVLRLEAEDMSALRAALNSYIRWMNIAENMSEAVGEING